MGGWILFRNGKPKYESWLDLIMFYGEVNNYMFQREVENNTLYIPIKRNVTYPSGYRTQYIEYWHPFFYLFSHFIRPYIEKKRQYRADKDKVDG